MNTVSTPRQSSAALLLTENQNFLGPNTCSIVFNQVKMFLSLRGSFAARDDILIGI